MYIHTLFVPPQRVMRLLNSVYYCILFWLLTFIFRTATKMMHIWLDTHIRTPLQLWDFSLNDLRPEQKLE